MPKDNNNLPTGLYWQGKRTEVERISLPFQTIETINESRATREKEKDTLFRKTPHPNPLPQGEREHWHNRIIWGDNKYVMSSLLDEFAGKIDLIYIDPPFATGADFSVKIEVGDVEWTKEPSAIEEKAYRDTWGKGLDSYLQMMYDRLVLMRDLLSEKGSIYVHLDWHVGHYVKIIMDQVFGVNNFRNEIIRAKCNPKNYTSRNFGNLHDTIFFYSKTDEYLWNRVLVKRGEDRIGDDFPKVEEGTGRRFKPVPLYANEVRKGPSGGKWKGMFPPTGKHWRYSPDTLDEWDKNGRIYWSESGIPYRKQYADEDEGMNIQDIWMEFKDIFTNSIYVTQKMKPFLNASSKPLLTKATSSLISFAAQALPVLLQRNSAGGGLHVILEDMQSIQRGNGCSE